ncbi:hypothetical protein BDV06DRAFT_205878 [Aspergillus oleicola]
MVCGVVWGRCAGLRCCCSSSSSGVGVAGAGWRPKFWEERDRRGGDRVDNCSSLRTDIAAFAGPDRSLQCLVIPWRGSFGVF